MTDNTKYSRLFTESGHLTEEGTAVYAEALFGQETGRLPDNMLNHVMECAACKQDCFELFELLKLQAGIEKDTGLNTGGEETVIIREPMAKYQTAGRSPVFTVKSLWKAAAVLLLLAGLGFIINNVVRNMRENTVEKWSESVDNQNYIDTLAKVEKLHDIHYWVEQWVSASPLLKADYQVNAKLESLFRLTFRSYNFEMLVPDSIAQFREAEVMLFSWTDKNNKELYFRIMDNKAKLIHQRRFEHQTAYEFRKVLQPGLYYWFFEQDHRTVAAGRFAVTRDQ